MTTSNTNMKVASVQRNTACIVCNGDLAHRPAVYCSERCERQDAGSAVAQSHGFFQYMGKWGPLWDMNRRPVSLHETFNQPVKPRVGQRRETLPRQSGRTPISKTSISKTSSESTKTLALEDRRQISNRCLRIVEYQDLRVQSANRLQISSSVTPIPTRMGVIEGLKSFDGGRSEWYTYSAKDWYALIIVNEEDVMHRQGALKLRMTVSKVDTSWDEEYSEGCSPFCEQDKQGVYWFAAILPRVPGQIKLTFEADEIDQKVLDLEITSMEKTFLVEAAPKKAKLLHASSSSSKTKMKQLKLSDRGSDPYFVGFQKPKTSEKARNVIGDSLRQESSLKKPEDSEGWVSAHGHEKSKQKKRKSL